MMLTGVVMMISGVAILFAMVVGVVGPGLFAALGAYALVIVGLVLSGFGVAAIVESGRWRRR